ncbi:hypothetical protein V1477_019298, partial [Vespula maculifrons]
MIKIAKPVASFAIEGEQEQQRQKDGPGSNINAELDNCEVDRRKGARIGLTTDGTPRSGQKGVPLARKRIAIKHKAVRRWTKKWEGEEWERNEGLQWCDRRAADATGCCS